MLGPVAFQRQFLKRNIWAKQAEMLNAVARSRSVSVKGCHGSGKTFAAAGLVPYELLSDKEAIVLTIAPTLRQVKLLWNEISGALRDCPVKFPEQTTTGLRISETNYALGFSSSKGVNAQGFHGKHVLIIADEAIGISADLWDAIEGIRSAGDVRLLKLCNPTVPSGAPFEDFTRLRGQTECITISAFDTPNLVGLTMESLLQLSDEDLEYAPFPWLTRRRWVREMYHKWGPNNPRFLSRVLGEFPLDADDRVFKQEWIEKSRLPYERDELKPYLRPGCYIQIGCDVAGPGTDETAMVARLGSYIVGQAAWHKADPINEAVEFLGLIRQRFPGVTLVLLGDTVGVGFHFMRQFAHRGYDVRCFVAGAAPMDRVQFRNAKAEAYWFLRECIRDGHVRGVEDEDTLAQLSDVRYRELPSGQIEIEHKDEAKARGSESPDRAEALIMAYARIATREEVHILNPAGSYQISPY